MVSDGWRPLSVEAIIVCWLLTKRIFATRNVRNIYFLNPFTIYQIQYTNLNPSQPLALQGNTADACASINEREEALVPDRLFPLSCTLEYSRVALFSLLSYNEGAHLIFKHLEGCYLFWRCQRRHIKKESFINKKQLFVLLGGVKGLVRNLSTRIPPALAPSRTSTGCSRGIRRAPLRKGRNTLD